jgi:3-methylcrotonyl-CoA carboxylase alpha subunit
VHLFERECSVQRRYQKIIEESPSPFIDAGTRAAMTQAAVRAARAVGYVNAGTVEFIVGADGAFYFMEMNTRLQVEHPVTELVTGLDLVEWQLRIAAGERLPLAQDALRQRGHAIEARLYSEDPRRGFLPSVGTVQRFSHPPQGPQWRVDAGIEDGDEVSVHYDPMIAKVIASGADREQALAQLARSLDRCAIFGVASNLPLLRALARHPRFAAGDVDTGFVDRELPALTQELPPAPEALLLAASLALDGLDRGRGASPWSAADGWRAGGALPVAIGLRSPSFLRLRARRTPQGIEVDTGSARISGRVEATSDGRYAVLADAGARELELIRHGDRLLIVGEQADEIALAGAWPHERAVEDADAHPSSPLPGRVVDLRVQAGDAVAKGDVMAVVEGMKMQHAIRAGRAGRVSQVLVRIGEQVEAEAVLFDIESA